jgi:Nuclease-related domain
VLKTGVVGVDGVSVPARRAGQYTREMTRRKAGLALIALASMIGAAGLLILVGSLSWGEIVALELALLAGLGVIDRFVVPEVERCGRGAAGEEHVGKVLAELEDDGYLAIHDIDTGRGNIDSVLVGPAGLFTIEVKSHGGRRRSDRVDPAWLRQAYAQKMWLERVAGRPVAALLVFSRAYLVGRAVSRRRGVVVLPARMLAGHVRRSRQLLSPEEARQLHQRLLHAFEQSDLGANSPATH